MKTNPTFCQHFCPQLLHCLAVTLIGLTALVGPAGAATLERLASECHSGKQKACDELAKIAVENKKSDVRFEAVRLLTDQSLLAKIAVQDPDKYVRKFAVSKLTDEAALEKIAVESNDLDVAAGALQSLRDQSQVFQVALKSNVSSNRSLATKKLTDQVLLSKLVLESTDGAIRSKAIEELTDQKSLEAVVTTSKDPAVRTVAVWKLKIPAVLGSVAQGDADENVREAARAASEWKTIQAEREVYVWKAPSDNASNSSMPHWRISGVLGVADLGEDIVDPEPAKFGVPGTTRSMFSLTAGSNFLLEQAINPEGAGFVPWWFQPESDQDACILESGKLPAGALEIQNKDASSPISFHGRVVNGKGAWAVRDEATYLFFQPKLHINPNGMLAMAGSVAGFRYLPGTQDRMSMNANTLQDAPVAVIGTIRFPQNQWTQAGSGFEILGGGLQFDETGVFLMVGTEYRKHAK